MKGERPNCVRGGVRRTCRRVQHHSNIFAPPGCAIAIPARCELALPSKDPGCNMLRQISQAAGPESQLGMPPCSLGLDGRIDVHMPRPDCRI